jgi:phage FluMu protein Com
MMKTYTCAHCDKIGSDFVGMAKEICPSNKGNGHQIPIFGDMKNV